MWKRIEVSERDDGEQVSRRSQYITSHYHATPWPLPGDLHLSHISIDM